jgi:excisionase family DNA binding protein
MAVDLLTVTTFPSYPRGPSGKTSHLWVQSEASGEGVSQLDQKSYSGTQFLTVAEVADLLRVSNMTVYRLIQQGELPAVRVGRSYRLRAEDVDAFLGAQFQSAG